MRKAITLAIILLVSQCSFGQYGYFPETISGNLNKRELANPSNSTLVGITSTGIGASDFSQSGELYAINSSNDLIIIDTTDASVTSIGSVTPSGSEFWTGMACDPTDGTMYVCSTDGNNSSYFTIDLSNASLTLIGSNNNDDGVVGIAFDDTGQMYAIYLVRKLYKIDKTTAVATLVGNLSEACSAFPHHGLDFNSETQTMYMVSYNAFTFDNELWTVNLQTAVNTLVGSVNVWNGTLAVAPDPFYADFTSDLTEVCPGGEVQFYDQSAGSPMLLTWTFEGGTPSTSTAANPIITYDSTGTWDVTLEIVGGGNSSTITKTDYITVFEAPEPIITGLDLVCEGDVAEYSTPENTSNTYSWEVNGGTIISGGGTHLINVEWGLPGTGYVTVTEDDGTCATTTEPFEVTIDECTGINENELKVISVYPNPAQRFLNIAIPGTHQVEVRIMSMLGEVMINLESVKVEGSTIELNVEGLKEGIYFLHINTKDGRTFLEKFIKAN